MSEQGEYEYKIEITRRKRNPAYKPPTINSIYNDRYDDPSRNEFFEVTELSTVLKQAEFDAVRKACLEAMP